MSGVRSDRLEWRRVRAPQALAPPGMTQNQYVLRRGGAELARAVPGGLPGGFGAWRVAWLNPQGYAVQVFDCFGIREAKRWAYLKAHGADPPADWRRYRDWLLTRQEAPA